MIAEELRRDILTYVGYVVYLQLSMILVLSGMTLALLTFRRWRNRVAAYHDSEFGDQIVQELLALLDRRTVKLIRRPMFFSWIAHSSLKISLLNQILLVNGVEKEFLVKRYFELGLDKDDMSLCASMLWWRRLEGISNLKKLSSRNLAKIFQIFRHDPHELVSAMSLSALSELRHPLNMMDFLLIEKLITNGQQTYISEVTFNWCAIHGYENVFRNALDIEVPLLREAMLTSLLNIKTQECSDLFAEFLQTGHYETPALLANILRTLKEIGDPSSLDAVTEYLYHPEELVQQRAIEYVLEFLPQERRGEMRILELDPSMMVQRTLQEWNSRKAAA